MTTDSPIKWTQSSYCGASACVQVAEVNGEYWLRDSKDPDGPVLRFTPAEWTAFLAGVRAGADEFPFPK